jgi:HTH-type transcriptional regulator / antitoxin HigA
MDDNNNRHEEVDALLSGILKQPSLRELFDKRMHELKVNQTIVQKMLKIERRTLNGIVDGTQKRADTWSLQKVALFMNIPLDEFIEIHSSMIERNFSEQDTSANKKKFIKENFDLAVLRRAGFINDIAAFGDIEKRIVSFFGLSSIFEYKKRSFDTAFSSGTVNESSVEKTTVIRDFWLTTAKSVVSKIDNPNHYDRQYLVNFFPQIRRYSTNEEFGLINVIKQLFKFGVTVLYLPRLSALKLRGAVFAVNNKPVVVLTDYKGFYPTLWHSLIHELYHVLFDWSIINTGNKSFHISDDTDELFTIDEREIEADDFARKYLFSKEKMEEVAPFIVNSTYVEEVARDNNVHPSIIYSYHAYDTSKRDRKAWMKAKRQMPDAKIAVHRLETLWNEMTSVDEIAKKLKLEIYN